MTRPRVRLAGPDDGPALLEILEDSPFPGPVELLYSRRPDAWDSLQREGREVLVYKLENSAGELAAFGACAANTQLVEGHPRKVGYLFSFRIRRGRERAAAWIPGGYRLHFREWRQRGVDCFLTTILADNRSARALLEKDRPSMPRYQFLGEIFTLSHRTRRRPPRLPRGWRFHRASREDLDELLAFRNREGRRFQYFPVVEAEDLVPGSTAGPARSHAPAAPPLECWYLLRDEQDRPAACGALWDQQDYKPYIAAGYRGIYRPLQPLSRWISPLLGLPVLPPAGTVLNQFCAGFLLARAGCLQDEARAFTLFLDSLSAAGARHPRGYDFFAFGLHQDNPLLPPLRRRRGIVLKSRLYRVLERTAPIPSPGTAEDTLIPYIEIGRL